ncbi:MAG: type III-A CRISPR-associated RAMP protein Csm4, partial [Candidatus Micrarchaeia archaeon]
MKAAIMMNVVVSADSPVIHSDTLFGAVCYGIRHIYGNDELSALLEEKKIHVSSTIPMMDDALYVPFTNPPIYNAPEGLEKKIRKQQFIRADAIPKLHEIDEDTIEDIFLSEPYKFVAVPHNMPNREFLQSENLFFSTKIYWNSDISLVVLYKGDDKKIEAALRLLADDGILRDKTSGGCFFELEIGDVDLPQSGNQFINLSLYIPTQDEAEYYKSKCSAYYKLIMREGRSENIYAKEKVKPAKIFIAEGSIFPCENKKELYGAY